MRFVETWLPLVVVVREGSLEMPELDELAQGFERQFERGTPFAVLSLTALQAPPMDALARHRLAEWANQPRIQRLSKELCAGTATVVAREGERRALTALLWIWTPAAPHDAVQTVDCGVDFCLARLIERDVQLPAPSDAFRQDICRGLSALPVAGLPTLEGLQHSLRPRKVSSASRVGKLERLADAGGHIVIGWLKAGVLWSSLHGHLSIVLAERYAQRLERLLRRAKEVEYFADSSDLKSFDLVGRTTALRALVESRQRFLAIRILNWSAGVSSTGRSMLQSLGEVVHLTEDAARFERMLAMAAPRARELIATQAAEAAASRLPGLKDS